MLKTLRIATILTGVSAFAIPAFAQSAQDNTIVPGNEAQIELNNAEVRNDVAAESDINLAQPENPVANPTNDTIVPGSEAQIELNEAETRQSVADGTAATTAGEMAGEGEEVLVPGSGATFAPGEVVDGQDAALQDESPDLQN